MCCCSVAMSNSLWCHGLQHTRLLCPPLSPGICSNSCPLSRWCYLTISFSPVPFSCLQSFPKSRSFPMSQLFASGSQSTGASASASVFPMNIEGWFPLGLTGLKCLLQHHNLKASILWCSAFFMVQLFHPYMSTGKKHSFGSMDLCQQSESLLFNVLSRFVIAFLPSSEHLFISWLQSLSAVTLESKKIKSVTAYTSPLLIAMKWWHWMSWS